MSGTKSPDEISQFMQILNGRVIVNKTIIRNGVEVEVNLLAGTGVAYMGHLLARNPTHIRVLLGVQNFAILEEEMEKVDVHFGMELLGWESPVRP